MKARTLFWVLKIQIITFFQNSNEYNLHITKYKIRKVFIISQKQGSLSQNDCIVFFYQNDYLLSN